MSISENEFPALISQAAGSDRAKEKWSQVVRSLGPLKSLADDWDGMGAVAPSAAIVQSAIELAERFGGAEVMPPTTAVATPAGTVLFGWQMHTGYAEVEIVAPDRAEWMTIDENGEARHGTLPSAF